MAYTKIKKIRSRLKKVIDYTTDKNKTSSNIRKIEDELAKVYKYATNSDKTEKQYYVSGINCTPEIAVKEMNMTKQRYEKIGGVLGYHIIQSFAVGEATHKIAHEIGIKLAEELWGDKFEVIVTTHLNTKCLHNHFVLNSVSFIDGKKYEDKFIDYALIRNISDSLCEEYKLKVMPEKPCPKSKINFGNFVKSKYQNSNYYNTTKIDIDRAIGQAYTYKDFENILQKYGYTLTYRANKLSVCREGYKRNIRIERAYGTEYTINQIKERIMKEKSARIPFQEVYNRKKYKCKQSLSTIKKIDKKYHTSLYRQYLYYRYKLNSYKKVEYKKPLSENQRNELMKMDEISEEVKFMHSKKIITVDELFLYKKEAIERLDNLETKHRKINYRIKKSTSTEEKNLLSKEKQEIIIQKQNLKREVEMCNSIELRIPKMKENVKEFKIKEERENNEHIR